MHSEDKLVPVYIPPLITLLLNAAARKGKPLTQAEVEAIRDSGICVALPAEVAVQMASERGYDDISPQHVWRDYLRFITQNENNSD